MLTTALLAGIVLKLAAAGPGLVLVVGAGCWAARYERKYGAGLAPGQAAVDTNRGA